MQGYLSGNTDVSWPSQASVFRRAFARLRFVTFLFLKKLGIAPKHPLRPEILLAESCFDSDWYLTSNETVELGGLSPYQHFIQHGYYEGLEARVFDNHWYLDRYPEVRLIGRDGAFHYFNHGRAEGRMARFIIIRPDRAFSLRNDYVAWLKTHDALLRQSTQDDFVGGPKISVLMPTYNSDITFLTAAIESVIQQSYENWELCIADDASTRPDVVALLKAYAANEPRIKITFRDTNGHISAASNSALELATGDYVGLLDHDDLLTPDAMHQVAQAINNHPDADLIYSDEDKIDARGQRFDPYFKSDFNYELLLAQNMISHFGVYRTALIRQLGGFRTGLEGAQDHDLALRVVEHSDASRIVHIPRVLYHWRAAGGSTALSIGEKSYATQAGLKAVGDHLERTGAKAQVEYADPRTGHYRVRYTLLDSQALVSIIIPTRDQVGILKACLNSIFKTTTYKSYEIIIIDNGSKEQKTFDYFASLPQDRVKVIRHDAPFNYSELNNIGANTAGGDYLCLMNNDITIITPEWIEEMLSFAQLPDIGCVGARLWYPNRTLQHAGVILGIGGVAGHAWKGMDKTSTGYFSRAVHHQSLSAVTAACLMIRSETYHAVGGLDETIAVAFNDVDFCLRVLKAGYRNIWTPYAEMIHHESASRGAELTPQQRKRFADEVDLMTTRWGDRLLRDPAYNPNLTLDYEDFSLAWPPRI